LGICLGSQLLADVLGGSVYKQSQKEIGWFPVSLTPEGRANPLFEGIEDTVKVFHWHGDTFTLPEKSIRLMESAACENQAYLYQTNILGLQFHLEVSPESVSSMLENDIDELNASGEFIQTKSEILDNLHYSKRANEILFILLERFLNL
jgi:GMP synthase-like glutamine amidotransferase